MTAQQKGVIKTWKDDKGFGFISPDDGGKEIFFHVSGITSRQMRPSVNAAVRYKLIYDQQQRPRAIDIHFGHAPGATMPAAAAPMTPLIITSLIVGIFFVALGLATVIIRFSPMLLGLYALMSIITFVAYHTDKSSAVRGDWRIPENILHLLEVCGGWPGALIAQSYYRHKTIKSSYQLIFWFIILLNLILLTLYAVANVSIVKR